MSQEYMVTVSNSFEAESPEDAVMQMVEWLWEAAHATGYKVTGEDGSSIILDAEKINRTWKQQ